MNSNTALQTRQEPPAAAAEKQMNRACEACRLLKVRCLPDETSPSVICQRCKRSGRICVYAAPQKRRQRIRTDTRVAELEREIRAMRSLLTGDSRPLAEKAQDNVSSVAKTSKEIEDHAEHKRSTPSSLTEESPGDGMELSWHASATSSKSPTPEDSSSSSALQLPEMDGCQSKEFGLLSRDTADWLFHSFNNDLSPHYPIIILPRNSTPDEIRRSKPILFQALVTAASCQLDSNLFLALFKKMTKVYADRIFMNGEKSLELIQALTISSVWYCPPEHQCGPSNLQFYQYIHMAATMALDTGIGIVFNDSVECLDECRCLLICYLNCAGVAMRMKRPNMLRWTPGMADCLKLIETSPLADPLHKRIAAWVKLQNIADEWSSSIVPAESIEPRVQLTLKGYERQLEKWKESTDPETMNVSLLLSYYQDIIYLHEAALEGGSTTLADFNHRAFKPPSVLYTKPPSGTPPLTAAYVSAVMACINSSHALLDEWLTIKIETLRLVPVIVYVRMSYATVVLVKLCLSAGTPGSELGKILDRETLKVDYYLKRLIQKMRDVIGKDCLRIPQKWLEITMQVKSWYGKSMSNFEPIKTTKPGFPPIFAAHSVRDVSFTEKPSASDVGPRPAQPLWTHAIFSPGLEADQKPHELGSEPSNTAKPSSSNVAAADENVQPFDYSAVKQPDASVPTVLEYLPMEFTSGDFSSFELFDNSNDWMADRGTIGGDIGFEPMTDDWAFDFK